LAGSPRLATIRRRLTLSCEEQRMRVVIEYCVV